MKRLIIILALVIFSCSKSDDSESNYESDVISRFTLELSTDSAPYEMTTWNNGDAPPTINVIADEINKVRIEFYSASDLDIKDRLDEYFVFFELSGFSDLSIKSSFDDYFDSNDIGTNLITQWYAGSPESGNVKISLIYLPTSKTGTTRSSLGGETLFELTFPTVVN
jgi:hypothetical protein